MDKSNTSHTAFARFTRDQIIDVPSGAIPTKETGKPGHSVINVSRRNKLRKAGLAALYQDLKALYGDTLDVIKGPSGSIVLIAENPDFTFAWELKSTIKGVGAADDPFETAIYDEDTADAA